MYRAIFLSAVSLVLGSGCGQSLSLPDGGRDRALCTNDEHHLAVTVVDAAGQPMEGATVTATNSGTGKSASGQTDGRGVSTAIREDIAPGTLQVWATLGSQISQTEQVTWVCGECDCTATPSTLTLTLSQ